MISVNVSWQQTNDGWLCTVRRILGPHCFSAECPVLGVDPPISALEYAEGVAEANVDRQVGKERAKAYLPSGRVS